jgi:ABC-type antimicrobial peptide transport system permease subunit
MVMAETAVLFGVGAGVGGVLALFGARATESLLFGLKPEDPATLAAAAGILAVGAALASYIPARRAATVSPVVALRQD